MKTLHRLIVLSNRRDRERSTGARISRRRSVRRAGVPILLVAGALLIAACQPPTLASAPVLPQPGGSVGPNECTPVSVPGVNYYGSLRYGHDNDFNEDLYLDALVPTTSTGPLPAVIYVHGGGHVGGNKCEGQGATTYLAQHGFVVFSIDYALATASQSAWYDEPADTELAVQWVRTNAATFGVNPNAIGLWGTSAGADVAFDAALEAQRSDPAAKVQAVSGWSGSYDFLGEYYRNPESSTHIPNAGEYLGCADPLDTTCVDTIVAASPLTYASHDDPPAFIASSTDFTTGCESVEPENSVEMVNALQARGVPVTFDTTNACAHALAYWKGKVNAPATGIMIDNLIAFLSQQLGSSPSVRTTPAPLPAPLSGPTVVTAKSTCAPSPGAGVTYTPNMTYGNDFNNPLYADVYRPAGVSKALPAVVLLHDGGFDAGDKCDADVSSAAVALAQQGFVAVSANYPLATPSQPTFPNPVYDVMQGIGALRANAKSLGIDPAHVALWGAGAGANVALDAAMAAPLVRPGAAVQAVVSYSGDTDAFEAMGEYQVAGVNEADVDWAQYIGCSNPVVTDWNPTANSCYGLYQAASPALLLDPFGGTFPAGPALLVVNSNDYTTTGTCETTPPRQATEMQLRGAILGLAATSQSSPDCAHGFGLLSSELTQTLPFLLAKLG